MSHRLTLPKLNSIQNFPKFKLIIFTSPALALINIIRTERNQKFATPPEIASAMFIV